MVGLETIPAFSFCLSALPGGPLWVPMPTPSTRALDTLAESKKPALYNQTSHFTRTAYAPFDLQEDLYLHQGEFKQNPA